NLCFLSEEVFFMTMPKSKRTLRKHFNVARHRILRGRFVPYLETLGERTLPSVTASFVPSASILSVIGDSLNNSIVVSRDAAGHILINGGAVAVAGGAPTVATTALIQVFGQTGNDQISLDEAN